MSADEIIRLNVGGRLITTTRATLTKHKDSMLERMFSVENPLPPALLVDGAYFIDENPDVFDAILTWLRHGVIDLKNVSLDHLKAAVSYFGLEDMRSQLSGFIVPTSDSDRKISESAVTIASSAREINDSLVSANKRIKECAAMIESLDDSLNSSVTDGFRGLRSSVRDQLQQLNRSVDAFTRK